MLKICNTQRLLKDDDYSGFDQTAYSSGGVSTSDAEAFLEAYGIPHDDITSIEPSSYGRDGFLGIFGDSVVETYVVTDANGATYYIGSDGEGNSYVTAYTDPAGNPTYYNITDNDEEFRITTTDTNGGESWEYAEAVDSNGHKVITYGKTGEGYVECVENDDGTISTTMYVLDHDTGEFVKVDVADYNGDIDSAYDEAMGAYNEAAAAHSDYDLSGSSSFNALFDGSGQGIGPSVDSCVDGLFFKSTHMADVFLDADAIKKYTNDVHGSLSKYTMDGSNITGFDELNSALGDAINCSSCGLPGASDEGCLGSSLDTFLENMSNALDDVYVAEHSNKDAFDEISDSDITVEIKDSDGKKYDTYSEYLLANNKTGSSSTTHTPGSFNGDLGSSAYRDLTPYYSKTTATGIIDGEKVKYTNEVKSNYTGAKGKANDSESLKPGTNPGEDILKFGSDFKASASAEYVFYSNSSKFETFDSAGNVVRTDESSLAVGKGSLSAEFKAGMVDLAKGKGADALSFTLHGEGAGLEFSHKTTDVNNVSNNFELNAKFLSFEGNVNVKIDNEFFGALYGSFGNGKKEDGTTGTEDAKKSLEDFANSDLFHIDGDFRADVLRVKVKGNIETAHAIVGYEEEVSFLSGKWATGKAPDLKKVRVEWPKVTIDFKGKEIWSDVNKSVNGDVVPEQPANSSADVSPDGPQPGQGPDAPKESPAPYTGGYVNGVDNDSDFMYLF